MYNTYFKWATACKVWITVSSKMSTANQGLQLTTPNSTVQGEVARQWQSFCN